MASLVTAVFTTLDGGWATSMITTVKCLTARVWPPCRVARPSRVSPPPRRLPLRLPRLVRLSPLALSDPLLQCLMAVRLVGAVLAHTTQLGCPSGWLLSRTWARYPSGVRVRLRVGAPQVPPRGHRPWRQGRWGQRVGRQRQERHLWRRAAERADQCRATGAPRPFHQEATCNGMCAKCTASERVDQSRATCARIPFHFHQEAPCGGMCATCTSGSTCAPMVRVTVERRFPVRMTAMCTWQPITTASAP